VEPHGSFVIVDAALLNVEAVAPGRLRAATRSMPAKASEILRIVLRI